MLASGPLLGFAVGLTPVIFSPLLALCQQRTFLVLLLSGGIGAGMPELFLRILSVFVAAFSFQLLERGSILRRFFWGCSGVGGWRFDIDHVAAGTGDVGVADGAGFIAFINRPDRRGG